MSINMVMQQVEKIKQDCLKLKRKEQLTEYGKGQLDMIKIISKAVKMEKEKYTTGDLKKIPKKAMLVKVGLMIANELHHIYSTLKKKDGSV